MLNMESAVTTEPHRCQCGGPRGLVRCWDVRKPTASRGGQCPGPLREPRGPVLSEARVTVSHRPRLRHMEGWGWA